MNPIVQAYFHRLKDTLIFSCQIMEVLRGTYINNVQRFFTLNVLSHLAFPLIVFFPIPKYEIAKYLMQVTYYIDFA